MKAKDPKMGRPSWVIKIESLKVETLSWSQRAREVAAWGFLEHLLMGEEEWKQPRVKDYQQPLEGGKARETDGLSPTASRREGSLPDTFDFAVHETCARLLTNRATKH